MTSSMLRRQLKNLVQNYSEAEVKVREATSNDPWGPSSTQMADISDLTYNVVACNEIMTMLWKRLKDDKNWRHIHKSLTLLEYLLKTGDDRVLLKMKDSIYIVKALTEYRFVEKDGKDQGLNVREKAKVVLVLMEDDEKLKEERDFAVKTREKTSKGAAASSSDVVKDLSYKPCYVAGASGLPSLDNIPSVADLTAAFTARKEERLRQEAEKKDMERRAKMSEDELQWEDAGKGPDAKGDAWAGEKEEKEEVKPDPWGASKQPKEATDPWGTPAKAEKPANNSSDPFSAPKDKEDPFAAPKDKADPFNSSNNDPFNTPKDDPFNAPKDDPFNAPKEDPFNAPKDDPFNAPKDDPFNAPKDDPFNSPKDDLFNAPKDDPFTALATTPPKEDPFAAPTSSKDDPFTAPTTPPKEDPFSVPTKPAQGDPFASPTSQPKEYPFSASSNQTKDDPFTAPTTPPKEDPFSAPSKPTKDEPFAASTTPPKEDPFARSSPPKDDAADPFNAPTATSLQGGADAWGAPATSAPASTDDAWGSPAPPSDSSTSGDPFGDGAAKANDPWGAPSNATSNTAGKRTAQEEVVYRKTALFLGPAAALLVDLDDLFSCNPAQRPLINTPVGQTQAVDRGLLQDCPFLKHQPYLLVLLVPPVHPPMMHHLPRLEPWLQKLGKEVHKWDFTRSDPAEERDWCRLDIPRGILWQAPLCGEQEWVSPVSLVGIIKPVWLIWDDPLRRAQVESQCSRRW
ncbi:putative clathrin interactor EPSIN 2-like isoform 3 [Scophthalmus maximus]|nr:putative clathrin interactor EPSIN 2-like isoform 3 [Scophthalmus maximus]